jgi:hypothetical protein
VNAQTFAPTTGEPDPTLTTTARDRVVAVGATNGGDELA